MPEFQGHKLKIRFGDKVNRILCVLIMSTCTPNVPKMHISGKLSSPSVDCALFNNIRSISAVTVN